MAQGNVGIGTSTPKSKLDVEGGITVGSGYSGSIAAPAEGMLIQGAVGIGTAPTAKLSISIDGTPLGGAAASTTFNTMTGSLNAAANSDLCLASIGYTSANQTSLGIHAFRRVVGGAWNNTNIIIGMDVDASPRAGGWISIGGDSRVGIMTAFPDQTFSVNGDASKTGGGAWLAFSDKRLKTDINEFKDGLDVLMQINPVTYKYNGLGGISDTESEFVGVIAQEIQEVAPYTVSTVNKKLNDNDAENTNLLMYDANALTYILINAVQEQQKRIEELEAENAELQLLKLEIEQIKVKLNTIEQK